MGIRKHKPTTPGRQGNSVADREGHQVDHEKALLAPGFEEGVAAASTGASPRHRAAATSSATASSTSAGTRTASCRPRWRRSSTTNRHRPRPCSTTSTGRSATSWRRPASGWGTRWSGEGADIKPGNALPLKNIPVGTIVHSIELRPGGEAQMGRSARSGIQLLAKEGTLATLRMPSGEIRQVLTTCRAAASARSATPSRS